MKFWGELYYGWVNVSFGCRVDTRVIAFPASPPPSSWVPGCLVSVVCCLLLTPMSSQIPRTIFGKSLLSLRKLIGEVHRQRAKWIWKNLQFPNKKELCTLCRFVLMDWTLRFIRSPLGQIWSPIPQIDPSNEGNNFHLEKSEVRGCLEAEMPKNCPLVRLSSN